jgi:hypothetical protein
MDCLKCSKFEQEEKNQKLGIELSEKSEYSGIDILEICMYALEDSNFHPESRLIQQLLKIENQ